ncbi:MAG: phosphoribosylaminoimidazole-succinocarboxamide synthase [Thermoanaerobacteraceae bacterium]|jgi:phosphoribosylaminoimidazole-succinocarboxamide synthase|uniref:Phosphoribosylaminoimidazole-succinocarboxamide synthase n=1 Tax=Biomaibacter acetigenes TaxID=2316383 RepID=A0A3G2R6R6_9FIRM|nr:phosphoribosylaminoimidazolesuccinocarboxamide synthase [Biomaibacter acetigenes]AYO31065.1 phosphoribosylaminoimidazolesuccinocarboxamide synthase [Biomaibacter acetigenes]MDK2877368.1 phosphoribosylaminoimidazole-succinocarboxamide synthase [Thermoanaerobacteraceae bacterium]MDN5301543.1 phosphoribosylaminoimidazole-succinocarboxamide synthase [Thermoanaerobacteraceae bacterium]RKL63855.1 phosphoribosylaminoimidazolesuccinocarboxamide synthase [Thermoanaerobacteraceae bacterium SP2]
MDKLDMLYEGKAKKVYSTEDKTYYIMEFKDDATAFNGQKKGTIHDKGIINNRISAFLFELLETNGIRTHFVKLLSDREMLVKAVKILPLEVIVRNIAAGSLAKRLGLEEGTELKRPVLELCYKNDELGDPMINNYHVMALGIAGEEQVKFIEETSLRVNQILRDYFIEKGIILVDFKLEFGIFDGEILLADEISPDTCRFWDAKTGEKLDKDRFRRDLGNVEEAYKEILSRIGKEI